MGAEGDVKVNSFPGPTKNKRRGDGTVLGLVKPFPVYRNGQMKEIPEAWKYNTHGGDYSWEGGTHPIDGRIPTYFLIAHQRGMKKRITLGPLGI